MKGILVFLSLVGLLFAIGAEVATAQSVHPQDVLRSTLRYGDPWGPARYQRCQAALRHGWGNASSCGAVEVPRHARSYNQRRGGFFGRGNRGGYSNSGYGYDRGYGYGGYYDDSGRWWAPVAATGIQVGGTIVMTKMNNNTAERMEGQRNRLEDKRVNNKHEIDLRHEDRTDAKLQVELNQLNGEYVPREVGSISQPQETTRTLYNGSSCEIAVYRNGRLKFTLPPEESILIPNFTYEWEADGCDVQVGEITISSARR